MFDGKLSRLPLLVLVTIAQLSTISLTSARATSVNLDTPQANLDCPKANRNSASENDSLLAQQESEIARLGSNSSLGNGDNLIAQLPENKNQRPLDSGCNVSGEGACDVAGGTGCEVGGAAPAGGGILPAVAGAGGGFPFAALAPLAAIVPLVAGGGGDGGDDNPSPEPIPEPSTVFGSTLALGAIAAIARKRKSRTGRKGRK